jgi:hypothetical protein
MKKEFYESWEFLMNHSIFNVETIINRKDLPLCCEDSDEIVHIRTSYFERCLTFLVVQVDPRTKEIDVHNKTLNTETRFWLEILIPFVDVEGDYVNKGGIKVGRTSGFDLDLSGSTFEDSIINLANLVNIEHGDDRESSIIVQDKTT